ncbi:hypothetical protein K1719_040134 [Acacia pycnantha]|nr:hypothetical protein K1719_040134 [Acacia pycnantha]
MPEMDGSSAKPPQISEMFQKFALAFKTKTFEFFADEDHAAAAAAGEDSDGFSLLDSAEDFITDQKVVVIKPDPACNFSPETTPSPPDPPVAKPPVETEVKRSCLGAQVEENQNKLRTLGTVSNRLQSELEQKHDEVSALRRKLDEIQKTNVKLSKKLCVANAVHPDINYAKKGHNQFALLSYVCLVMFQGFDLEDFGLNSSELLSDGHDSD